MRKFLRGVVELVLPAACAGCGEWGWTLCPRCARILAHGVFRSESFADRLVPEDAQAALPVWSMMRYAGEGRRMTLEWKRHGRSELAQPFRIVFQAEAQRIAPVFGTAMANSGAVSTKEFAVIPVPSRAASQRRRGESTVNVLAQAVVAGLREGGLEATYVDCLARAKGSRDQAGLGARERSRNRMGSTEMKKQYGAGGRTSRPAAALPSFAVLVDDVMTTGASLLDAERVLSANKIACCGAFVLASATAHR